MPVFGSGLWRQGHVVPFKGGIAMLKANVALLPSQNPIDFDRINTVFDKGLKNTLWIHMARDPVRQNFSLPLLDSLQSLLDALSNDGVTWRQAGISTPINYAVLKSDHPDFFSLGGDLRHFRACIETEDKKALFDYSKLCLDILYDWATKLHGRATTISLIQGRALGGGFEAALASDFIIAEEQSEFGFPEIMFGLFPCTGGMSLLSRRVGVYQAERMMTNGKIYSAQELLEMGVIDELCEKGTGVEATEKFIARHSKHLPARLMMQKGRYRLAPLDYEELITVAEEWAETAMRLPAEDLRVMEMLGLMQSGR